MDKFLSVPVTGEPVNMLVSVSDVIGIAATTTGTTTITYNSGNTVVVAHGTVVANAFRDDLQAAMEGALKTQWTNVVAAYTPIAAVTGLTIA